jgi:hypothetical protein
MLSLNDIFIIEYGFCKNILEFVCPNQIFELISINNISQIIYNYYIPSFIVCLVSNTENVNPHEVKEFSSDNATENQNKDNRVFVTYNDLVDMLLKWKLGINFLHIRIKCNQVIMPNTLKIKTLLIESFEKGHIIHVNNEVVFPYGNSITEFILPQNIENITFRDIEIDCRTFINIKPTALSFYSCTIYCFNQSDNYIINSVTNLSLNFVKTYLFNNLINYRDDDYILKLFPNVKRLSFCIEYFDRQHIIKYIPKKLKTLITIYLPIDDYAQQNSDLFDVGLEELHAQQSILTSPSVEKLTTLKKLFIYHANIYLPILFFPPEVETLNTIGGLFSIRRTSHEIEERTQTSDINQLKRFIKNIIDKQISGKLTCIHIDFITLKSRKEINDFIKID